MISVLFNYGLNGLNGCQYENLAAKAADFHRSVPICNEVAKFHSRNIRKIRVIRSFFS